MRLYYVAGPYSARTQERIDTNVNRAALVAQKVWLSGNVAICPHLNTYGFEDMEFLVKSPEGHSTWARLFKLFLVGDFEIIKRCDGLILLPGWAESKGSCAEFAFASWLGIPVYFYPDVPEEVINAKYVSTLHPILPKIPPRTDSGTPPRS